MPFDILNMLMEQFQKVGEQLKARMEKSPEKVEPEKLNQFQEMKTALSTAQFITDRLSDGDKPLAEKDAATAGSFYQDYIEKAEAFVSGNIADIPADMQDLYKEIRNTLVVVKGQAASLEKIGSGNEPRKRSMYDVMSDYGWVENIFSDDPKRAEYEKEPKEKWNVESHTMADNLKKYRVEAAKLQDGLYAHLATITGSEDSPFEILREKLNLLQRALVMASAPGDLPYNVSDMMGTMENLYDKFNPSNLDDLTLQGLVTSNSINRGFGTKFDIARMAGDLQSSGYINKAQVRNFNRAFTKLELKPANLGIPAESIQALDDTAQLFNVFAQAKNFLIQNNNDVNPVDTNDVDSPIFMAVRVGDRIENYMKGFLLGESRAKAPTEQDIRLFMDSLANSSMRTPIFDEDGAINHNCASGIQSCETISEFIPSLAEHYRELKEQYDRTKAGEIMQPYSAIAQNQVDTPEYDRAVNQFAEMIRAHIASPEQIDRFRFLRMCRDDNFRDELLQSNDPKDVLLAGIAEYEFNCTRAYANSGQGIKNEATHLYNHALAKAFFNDRAMTEGDITKVEEYYDAIMNSNVARELMTRSAAELRDVVAGNNIGNIIYGAGRRMPETLQGETLDALTQTSGNLYTSNSEQYDNIRNAIHLMSTEAQTPQGISKQTYQSLYNACNVYLCTHDSKPASPNGKLRFNAAATVLAELAPKMIEKYPDMQDQIERDVKIHMIRSKHFRDKVAEFNPEGFGPQAARVEEVLQSTVNTNMITGKAATLDIREALLDKFQELEGQLNARNAEQQNPEANPQRNREAQHAL